MRIGAGDESRRARVRGIPNAYDHPVASLRAFVERIIPNRANRTVWWLVTLTILGFNVTGPIATSVTLPQVMDRPLLRVMVVLLLTNLVVTALAAGLMAVLLRGPQRVSPARAIAYTALVAALGTAIRLAALSTWQPQYWWRFAALQLAMGLVFLTCASVAIIYGSVLERALESSFTAHARTQSALLHEEESVRGQVFDQLHGGLQAEFVSMRRILDDLAERTSDPEAAATARALDGRLEAVYRRGVETVARALSPAGIEAGLLPAVRELRERLVGASDVEIETDPIVRLLDDPTTGGMRREVRLAAYRVIEEAVSNASRHARASQVDVRITSTLRDGQPQLLLHVSSPCPHRVEVIEGQGLTRMRSRVDALGGDVRLTSTTDTFTISARLPLQAPAPI